MLPSAPSKSRVSKRLILGVSCFVLASFAVGLTVHLVTSKNRKSNNASGGSSSSLRAAPESQASIVPTTTPISVPQHGTNTTTSSVEPATPVETSSDEETSVPSAANATTTTLPSSTKAPAATSPSVTPSRAPATTAPMVSTSRPPSNRPSIVPFRPPTTSNATTAASNRPSSTPSRVPATTTTSTTGRPTTGRFVPVVPTSSNTTGGVIANGATKQSESPVASPFVTPPTFPPVVFPAFDEASTTFRLKMYWQEGYFWQEETRERYWCVECAQCDRLNFNDDGAGCDYVWDCAAGHQLWLHGCRNGYGHVFQAVKVMVTAAPGDDATAEEEEYYHQIKVHETNLCLTRTLKRYLTVQDCDATDDMQLWHKIRADGGPFTLRPANHNGLDTADQPFCVTQQHHPKPTEILGLKECREAHRWDTGYWSTYELYSDQEREAEDQAVP